MGPSSIKMTEGYAQLDWKAVAHEALNPPRAVAAAVAETVAATAEGKQEAQVTSEAASCG